MTNSLDAPARQGTAPPRGFWFWRRLSQIAGVALAGFLPCPDLVSRRRVRHAARRLVTCSPWPEDDADGLDVARLALLRLLWLQRQTRRAVRGRHREASVMLARASTEGLILGLYCLHRENVAKELEAASIKAVRDVLYYLAEAGTDLAPREVIDQCVAALGTPPRRGPAVGAMAEAVDNALGGGEHARSLYRRFYIPLSNFTVHAGAGTLMRHVGRDGKLRARPGRAWSRRAPCRIADGGVGVMALAIAERTGKPSALFARYGGRHLDRALLPLAVMVMTRAAGSARPRQMRSFRAVVRTVIDTGTYLRSEQAMKDLPEVRQARIRGQFAALLGLAGDRRVPREAFEPLADHLSAKLAAEWGPASPPPETRGSG